MTFSLKFGKPFSREEIIARKIARQAIREQQKSERIITEWIDENFDFDKEKYFKIWEKYRKEYGNKFIFECIRTMAIANSVVDTNSILARNMQMPDVSIPIEEFNLMLKKLFVVNLTTALLEKNNLSRKAKETIIEFVIEKEFRGKSFVNSPINLPMITT
jgi:hypothetical protein